jgi:uncharacterized protein (TIGR04222 family)
VVGAAAVVAGVGAVAEHPWGISGPAFVWLYLLLLIVPIVVGPLWLQVVKQRQARRGEAGRDQPLSVYQVAYLAEGADQATDTVIAALVDQGRLRVNSAKKLHAVGSVPTEPLERAVSDAAHLAEGATTSEVRNAVAASKAMRALTDDLAASGLIDSQRKRERVYRAVLGYSVALGIFGAVRWAVGNSLGHPIGVLTALLIADVLLVLFALQFVFTPDLVGRTPAGRRLVDEARSEQRAARRSETPTRKSGVLPVGAELIGVAGVVALGGLAMYPDQEVGEALMPPVFGGSGGGGGGSGGGYTGCGSSGSSCSGGAGGGGGGCGGGGCGGGGGG